MLAGGNSLVVAFNGCLPDSLHRLWMFSMSLQASGTWLKGTHQLWPCWCSEAERCKFEQTRDQQCRNVCFQVVGSNTALVSTGESNKRFAQEDLCSFAWLATPGFGPLGTGTCGV